MKKGRASLRTLGYLLWLTLAASMIQAQVYTPVQFSYNARLAVELTGVPWPAGYVTLGGIPFVIPTGGNDCWSANKAPGSNPRILDVTTNRYGVKRVYTLINTLWGQSGGPLASLEFWGSSGAYHKKDLVGGEDIRDYLFGTFANSINGTTSTNVFLTAPGHYSSEWRLDMQRIELPSAFAYQTLTRIRLSDSGATGSQRAVLHGVTLQGQYPVGGSMAQLASGGTWKTTITLVNPGTTAATARLRFFNNDGDALRLPLTFSAGAPETTSLLERTLQPDAMLLVETTGPNEQATAVGWAQLEATGSVTGYAVFRQKIGEDEQEAVVPLESRNPEQLVLSFDNTAGYATGVALANTTPDTASITVQICDDTGRSLGFDMLSLPAQGHTSFALASRYAVTAGIRGTIEFRKPAFGQISILGLRFNPRGSFTSIPAVSH